MGLKVRSWLNLSLVVMTTYIIISYIFKSSDNQCQMTFMMEPPKFIPVPVEPGSASSIETEENKKELSDNYTLYMYSELGFPMASDMRRDLKDSMPVLFVPGNAGSYQQVRSLASTCIRRQLQSLDAFKFIFYTIDFRGQLSGISGHLIEEQVKFVHRVLNQISSMHPPETEGTILIGHSVGGFITKALFTLPDFDSSQVPLLINLASPLTKPFLNIDKKMQDLYTATTKHWAKNAETRNTLAVSISGGKTDRLVPMHLSLDDHYDLSLATNSIKDVWLATDHVSITWCRELMHKLARLLSAVMDKKNTHLIGNRTQALDIIIKELLSGDNLPAEHQEPTVIPRDLRIKKPQIMVPFEDYHTTTRTQLIGGTVIFNMSGTKEENAIIWIEHIDDIRENVLYGCRELNSSFSDQFALCVGKTDLIRHSRAIPSRKFEPKKTMIELNYIDASKPNFIVMDFVPKANSQGESDNGKIPEVISLQSLDQPKELVLSIPSLYESVKGFLPICDSTKLVYNIEIPKKRPIAFVRFRLENLEHATRFFIINLETINCELPGQPRESIALLYHGKYLGESFHRDKKTLAFSIKLGPHKSIVANNRSDLDLTETYLEFYLDGTCDSSLHFKLDIWSLLVSSIQNYLDTILVCSAYISYVMVVRRTLAIELEVVRSQEGYSTHYLMLCTFWLVGFVAFYSLRTHDLGQKLDRWVNFTTILLLSSGLVAFLEYIIKQLVDLALILNNIHNFIRTKIHRSQETDAGTNQNDGNTKNGLKNIKNRHLSPEGKQKRLNASSCDWLLIGLTWCGSFLFSQALTSICVLFMIIKTTLIVEQSQSKNSNVNEPTGTTVHSIGQIHKLLTSVATLCSLTLLVNTPAALLRINHSSESSAYNVLESDHIFASSITLVYVKLICSRIEKILDFYDHSKNERVGLKSSGLFVHIMTQLPTKYAHPVALLFIGNTYTDISSINLVLMVSLLWVENRLMKYVALKSGRDQHC